MVVPVYTHLHTVFHTALFQVNCTWSNLWIATLHAGKTTSSCLRKVDKSSHRWSNVYLRLLSQPSCLYETGRCDSSPIIRFSQTQATSRQQTSLRSNISLEFQKTKYSSEGVVLLSYPHVIPVGIESAPVDTPPWNPLRLRLHDTSPVI